MTILCDDAEKKPDPGAASAIPTPLPVIADAIPAELKECAQWVAWTYRSRNGRATKVPINPHTGGFAEVDGPATWGTFEEARGRQRGDHLPGVGFVFTAADPYCGIDFDKCRDPESGAIDPEAQEMIDQLDTYFEVSPSGTGVKGIMRATIPGHRNRTGHIEMYDRLRFFTITGQRLSGPRA